MSSGGWVFIDGRPLQGEQLATQARNLCLCGLFYLLYLPIASGTEGLDTVAMILTNGILVIMVCY